MAETVEQGIQADMENEGLQAQLEAKQQRIDELEQKVTQLQQKPVTQPTSKKESEAVKKLQFDNQILMNRLGQYKKAEKGAKDIVTDYETMKMKYFNVLTENQKQKTQISDFMQVQVATEVEVKSLQREREKQIG